jgi:hypothetical protein
MNEKCKYFAGVVLKTYSRKYFSGLAKVEKKVKADQSTLVLLRYKSVEERLKRGLSK